MATRPDGRLAGGEADADIAVEEGAGGCSILDAEGCSALSSTLTACAAATACAVAASSSSVPPPPLPPPPLPPPPL